MAPRKKRKQPAASEDGDAVVPKREPKITPEQLICRNVLMTIDQCETRSTHDRFSIDEKRQLLEAYNTHGFQVFQDMKLLQRYLPTRTENDLKGLVSRLSSGVESSDTVEADPLDGWQQLSLNLMGSYNRYKQVNVDDVLADALSRAADELDLDMGNQGDKDGGNQPNYTELLRSFSQLLAGRFPDNMTPENARLSLRLYDHVNMLAESIDIGQLQASISNGSWLNDATVERQMQQKMALEGLKEVNGALTLRDIDKNGHLEALCKELPKIRHITELLNPLRFDKSLANLLSDQ